MAVLSLSNISEKILVIGSIYGKIDLLEKIKKLNYNLIIINGNILFDADENKVNILKFFLNENKNIIYVNGNHDLKYCNFLYNERKNYLDQSWILSNPTVVKIGFLNSFSVTILNGELKSNIDDIENAFESKINNWHKYYNGDKGYIISNSPLTNKPIYHQYSMQLGTDKNNDIYGQEIDCSGLKNLINISIK